MSCRSLRFNVWGTRHHYAILLFNYVFRQFTVNKYCTYEESTCIHGNSDSKTVLMLLKCFLKDMANAELVSYEDIYSSNIV